MDVSSANKRESPLSIRRATAEDYDQIVEVWLASELDFCPRGRDSKQAFCRQVEQFPDLYLVAADADQIVGVVLGSHDHRKGWINRLAVLPEYRRRGAARALVTACEAAIASHGIEIVAAFVYPSNAVSCAAFEELGYRTDVLVSYYRKLSQPDA